MNRSIRLLAVLILATLVATHTPIHAILVAIVALSFEDVSLGDCAVLFFAALFSDHAGHLPLGISLFPLAVTYALLHLLKSQIYVQSFPSRLVWSVSAVLFYHVLWAVVLMVRGAEPFYVGLGMLRQLPITLLDGVLAAALSPALHRLLTVTWNELRRPRRIVVP